MARKKKGKELSMRKIREVLRLAEKDEMSEREIARSCSISHVTVGKYLRLAEERGLNYSRIEGVDDVELKRLLKGKKVGKKSDRPQPDWGWVHGELKKKSVTLYLLWQEYKAIHAEGYQPTQFYDLYNRWVNKLDVSLRQTYKAGEKLFVDYAGQTVGIVDRQTGEEREAQIFVAVLGASNYSFSCAVWDQSLSNWIEVHIKAFEYFGGVTEIVICDNLKSGVSKSCRYEPDINPTYHDMAIFYGTAIVPARADRPKDKAQVSYCTPLTDSMIIPLASR